MKKSATILAAIAAVPLLSHAEMSISKAPFGTTKAGQEADLFTLDNGEGTVVQITNYGGIITSVKTPDKDGNIADVVLGFDTLGEYEESSPYFGCITGRYCNRIAKGKFSIDGKEYSLVINNEPNHLHGGTVGFDKVVWDAATKKSKRGVSLVLTRKSPDGEEGYPGNLDAKVTYTLNKNNGLRIDYVATTDKTTHVNLTNHSYFNLEGHGSGDVLKHRLMIKASKYNPTDETAIPTGELADVAGTPFDFRKATPIGKEIEAENEQIKIGKGLDHNWVLDGGPSEKLRIAARVVAPGSKRTLTVRTTEPGIQLYTGNFLEEMKGKAGKTYNYRGAFCLETQHFPDSPNQSNFPSTLLKPGETYKSTTVFQFGIAKPKKAGAK